MIALPRFHYSSPHPSPVTLLKPKYLRAVKTPNSRNSSASNRLNPHPPTRLSVSLSRKSRALRPKTPQLPCFGETSLLGKNRIALLWTQKRAEPLSPLSPCPELHVDIGLELEGMKIRHSEGKSTDFRVRRSRLRPLELEIPSVPLRTEAGSEDER